MGSGLVAHQNGTEAVLKDGHLAYHPKGKSTDNVTYNVMSTPKGRQFQVTLPDGTKVWLNAASSLRFPTVFTGKDRTVELTGEGYFEVAHNSAMPFQVKVYDMTITVLGTHFDINSYSDEPAVKTTLLQGRILVNRKDKLVYLNPGQQAVVVPDEKDIKINYNVDVAEVMAWKNGRFIFNNADIRTIMRQVKRWYDVEVEYEGKISTEEFVGGISMQNNISELLKVLQGTNLVRFKLIGKKVIVTP
jgi:ferric-dicitrate binding protein FerR (iron transport regulator)